MNLWRNLIPEEEKEFRQAAREKYEPFSELNCLWHPIYLEECIKINIEQGFKVPEGIILRKKDEP